MQRLGQLEVLHALRAGGYRDEVREIRRQVLLVILHQQVQSA